MRPSSPWRRERVEERGLHGGFVALIAPPGRPGLRCKRGVRQRPAGPAGSSWRAEECRSEDRRRRDAGPDGLWMIGGDTFIQQTGSAISLRQGALQQTTAESGNNVMLIIGRATDNIAQTVQ